MDFSKLMKQAKANQRLVEKKVRCVCVCVCHTMQIEIIEGGVDSTIYGHTYSTSDHLCVDSICITKPQCVYTVIHTYMYTIYPCMYMHAHAHTQHECQKQQKVDKQRIERVKEEEGKRKAATRLREFKAATERARMEYKGLVGSGGITIATQG